MKMDLKKWDLVIIVLRIKLFILVKKLISYVKELANLMGYGINSFRVKFKENFGIPAYQWLLNEKAKRILKCLTTEGEDFKSIIDDFDFSSHSHFYKFCKTQFGLTPEELKKKLNS